MAAGCNGRAEAPYRYHVLFVALSRLTMSTMIFARIGWAIEGAIGSTHKIDASYLSPNVNMEARLEAATKQYSVPLLFSGS